MIYQLKVIHSVTRVNGEEISRKYYIISDVVIATHYLQVWVLAQ